MVVHIQRPDGAREGDRIWRSRNGGLRIVWQITKRFRCSITGRDRVIVQQVLPDGSLASVRGHMTVERMNRSYQICADRHDASEDAGIYL